MLAVGSKNAFEQKSAGVLASNYSYKKCIIYHSKRKDEQIVHTMDMNKIAKCTVFS